MSTSETNEQTNLPVVHDAGWEVDESTSGSILGTLLKCVDGVWTRVPEGTPVPPGTRLLALGTQTALVHWKDQKPVEEIVKQKGVPLPDIDELNSAIPQAEWETGLDGHKRPPWVKTWRVFLISPESGERFMFSNSTTGAMRAVLELADGHKWICKMRGERVLPLVELRSRTMSTKFGMKMRPHFEIVDWWDLNGNTVQSLSKKPLLNAPITNKYAEAKGKSSPKIVEPVTIEEELDDQIPF